MDQPIIKIDLTTEPDADADANADWLKLIDDYQARDLAADAEALQHNRPTLKHLAGQHNQKRHGWRYSESAIARYITNPHPLEDLAEGEVYIGRYNVRRGKPKPAPKPSSTSGVPVPFYWNATQNSYVATQDIPANSDLLLAGSSHPMIPVKAGQEFPGFFKVPADTKANTWMETNPADAETTMTVTGKAAQYKQHVARTLAADTGLLESNCSDFIQAWAHTSNDHSYQSMQTQEVIAEEFGSKLSPWQKENYDVVMNARKAQLEGMKANPSTTWVSDALKGPFRGDHGQLSSVVKDKYGTEKEATRALVRAQYKRTQDELRAAGITHVTVYRGVVLPKSKYGDLKAGDVVDMSLNPLESWSIDYNTAHGFAVGDTFDNVCLVVGMTVPISRIFSTPKTGFGCLRESEFTILNGDDQAIIVARKNK